MDIKQSLLQKKQKMMKKTKTIVKRNVSMAKVKDVSM